MIATQYVFLLAEVSLGTYSAVWKMSIHAFLIELLHGLVLLFCLLPKN
jgi:hypothetical protein